MTLSPPCKQRTSSSLKLETHNQAEAFEKLKAEWNSLVFRSTGNRIFSTWEWQSTWWEVYQPGQLWIITCRDEDGTLVGIAPWFIHNDKVSIIGCKEVTDYLDLIVDQDCVQSVLTSFAEYLAQNRLTFEQIEFCNLPDDSISRTMFPELLEQQGFDVTIEHEDVCPIVDLPDEWTDYLMMLDKKQRHELRRKLRRAQGNTGPVDWYTVGPEHDLNEEMNHFLAMMAASDPSKAAFLEDTNNRRFFRELAPVMTEKGWLQLNFLTVDGDRAASYLNFDYNNEVLVYNSGLQGEYGYLSPGIILLAYTIQNAIETGHRAFDFLQGDESYKYHMGGKDIAVWNLIAK